MQLPHISVNFDSVPDEIKGIDPGIYIFSITEAVIEPNSKGTGSNLIVTHKVDEPSSPMNNRTFKNFLSIDHEMGRVSIKQLMKSCGIPTGANGLDLEDLMGKVGKARLKADTYKDKETGAVKETTRVAEYLYDK